MRLKTRVRLAWLELIMATALMAASVGLYLSRPKQRDTIHLVLDAAFAIFMSLPLCETSWKRLRQARAQRLELGSESSADPWSSPGSPLVFAMIVLALAAITAVGAPPLFHSKS